MLILQNQNPQHIRMEENEKQRKFLIFLTGEFPYGSGETFIENELPFLARAFEKVFILVPEKVTNKPQRPIPQNATTILIKKNHPWVQRLTALANLSFWQALLLDLKRKKRPTSFLNIFRNDWHYFTHALQVRKAILNMMIQKKLKPEETIFYSYWMDDKALGAALIKRDNPGVKAVSRAHRWDIYEEMHPIPFLPFRPWLGFLFDRLVFISKQGQDYFEKQFSEIPINKLVVSYLGTLPLEPSLIHKSQKEFTIVSCSSLISRKRVELIARAILELNLPINWTHIGDGPDMETIRKFVQEIESKGGKVNLAGNLPNQAVRRFYEQTIIDLFISTSASEGLPVSMMEAQSAGIPILATDVGGVNEIVIDGVTGWLLPPDSNAATVAKKIREIYDLQEAEKQKIRQNALKHWQIKFNADENYAAFVNLLQNL